MAVARTRSKQKASSLARSEILAGYAFISPWLLGFILLTAGPMLFSLYLSFTEYDVIQAPKFVGLENYQELFRDPRLGLSLWNSFFYTVFHVPLSTLFALFLALTLIRVSERCFICLRLRLRWRWEPCGCGS
jgi:multiple sugar transport system permease protein